MSVQLNQQTRSTRFSRGSLPDWYMWKCSVKNYRPKAVQTSERLLPFMANQLNKSWLSLISLPSLLPKDTPGKFQTFLKAGAILGSWVGPTHTPPTPTNSSSTSPKSHMTYSMDLLRYPYPYYFSHHSSLSNMCICLLPTREGEPFLALRARFPAIHQSLKVYSRP